MHLARRSYVLVVLTAVLAVAGIWSSDPYLAHLWRIPAALLLLGLALEGAFVRRLLPQVRLQTAARAFLGRAQPAAFVFANPSRACHRARVRAGDAGGLRGTAGGAPHHAFPRRECSRMRSLSCP